MTHNPPRLLKRVLAPLLAVWLLGGCYVFDPVLTAEDRNTLVDEDTSGDEDTSLREDTSEVEDTAPLADAPPAEDTSEGEDTTPLEDTSEAKDTAPLEDTLPKEDTYDNEDVTIGKDIPGDVGEDTPEDTATEGDTDMTPCGSDANPTPTWYPDGDGDGFGDDADPITQCESVEGRVMNALDCDDTTRDFSPAAPEICDGMDNNCDGRDDEANAMLMSNCEPPANARLWRCRSGRCEYKCLPGAQDRDGDLQDGVAGNGCEDN